MADEVEQHWRDVAREAREQAHVNAEHCEDLLAKLLDGCHAILLATEAIAGSTNRVGFVEDVYRALLRCAKGQSEAQLRVEVQAMWEKRRG